MGETTIKDDLVLIVHDAENEELAELAKDPGLLGEAVRKELEARGHEVRYSNVNGVQECSVTLKELIEQIPTERADSADVMTSPGQTREQQAEGTDEIDPTYAAGAQETGADTPPSSPSSDEEE